MSEVPYVVEVEVGPYSWTVAYGDPPSYGPTLPFRFGWGMPDEPLDPVQPDPTVARFGLVAADPADLDQLRKGLRVELRVWLDPLTDRADPADAPYAFDGVLDTIEAKSAGELGMRYELTAVDTTALLSTRYNAGALAAPVETPYDRLDRWAAEAGVAIDRPPPNTIGVPSYGMAMSARPADVKPLGELLRQTVTHLVTYRPGLIATHVPSTVTPSGGGVLAQYWTAYVAVRGALIHAQAGRSDGVAYVVQPAEKRHDAAAVPLPGALGVDPVTGLVGVRVDPDQGGNVIPADVIPTDVSFRLAQDPRFDAVTVNLPNETSATVRRSLVLDDDAVVGTVDVGASSLMYGVEEFTEYALSDGGAVDWGSDKFRVRLGHLPDPATFPQVILNPWRAVPPGGVDPERAHFYTRALVLAGLDPVRHPAGRDWVAGRLRGAELLIEPGGDVFVDLELRYVAPRVVPYSTRYGSFVYTPDPVPYLSCASLAAAASTLTPADLDPRYTVANYRIVGA